MPLCLCHNSSYMNKSVVQIALVLPPEQAVRLVALQQRFSEVCNALVPLVRETGCWHRVTLHHIAYPKLRREFPDIGSQMACNAIYSVSRTCRLAFQSPDSPFFRSRRSAEPLPELRFLPTSPVFFDRHTVSIKDGMLSMFTLGGRMRFLGLLSPEIEARFVGEKLRDIVLVRPAEHFQLNFIFSDAGNPGDANESPEFCVILPEPHADTATSTAGGSDVVLQVAGRNPMAAV